MAQVEVVHRAPEEFDLGWDEGSAISADEAIAFTMELRTGTARGHLDPGVA